MPQEVTAYLKAAKGLTDDQRADLWDAYYNTSDPNALAEALQSMDAPQAIKADLWDLKASGAGAETVAQEEPAQEEPAPEGSDLIGKGLNAVAEYGGALPGVGPMLAGGAAGIQALRQSETPTAAAAEFMRAGMQPGLTGAMTATPMRGAGVLARLPGMVGTGMRAAANPLVAGGTTAAVQLARGRGAIDAGISGVEVAGLVAGGRAGGAQVAEKAGLSRLARLLRLGGKKPAAKAAEQGAAKQVQSMVKPKVVGGSSSAGGGTVQSYPVPRPAQVAPPTQMGPSATTSTMPGAAPAAAPRAAVAEAAPRVPPQTPIGQARSPGAAYTTPRLPTPAEQAAATRAVARAKAGAKQLGLTAQQTQKYEEAVKAVLNAQYDGTLSIVTPSGAPSQLAKTLAEKFGESMGLKSPRIAQNFINGVLRMSEQEAVPAGLGMAIRSIAGAK